MLLALYKLTLSPIFTLLFGHACRFTPTCSEYASDAVHKYGIFKGGLMSVKRIIRCNPLSSVKYDPVV